MGLIINTRGVELTEVIYIDKEGQYTFKITKFEDDGFTRDSGDQKFKLHFVGKAVGTTEPMYNHTEMFNIGAKSLWRIKQLEVALNAPECYDIESFIGRYVTATIVKREYKKNDGTTGTAYNVKTWEYSKLNDTLAPIPEAKEPEDTFESPIPIKRNIPEIDISDEEVPF